MDYISMLARLDSRQICCFIAPNSCMIKKFCYVNELILLKEVGKASLKRCGAYAHISVACVACARNCLRDRSLETFMRSPPTDVVTTLRCTTLVFTCSVPSVYFSWKLV